MASESVKVINVHIIALVRITFLCLVDIILWGWFMEEG